VIDNINNSNIVNYKFIKSVCIKSTKKSSIRKLLLQVGFDQIVKTNSSGTGPYLRRFQITFEFTKLLRKLLMVEIDFNK
jgi:hypothetical protein